MKFIKTFIEKFIKKIIKETVKEINKKFITIPSANSRETTRQVVCSLQLSDQISKFWLL